MAGRPIICVGDKTDHGGVVIEGSAFDFIDGKAIARVGDKVTCPKHGCPSTTVIVTGDMTNLFDGKAVARHGDKTACGATVISSQFFVTTESGATSGGQSGSGVVSRTGTSPTRDDSSAQTEFNERFQLRDSTGAPAAGAKYAILRASGALEYGTTDANGLTHLLANHDSAESVKIYFGGYEDA